MAKTSQRLRGNASGRNGSRRWFCTGCKKHHSISRDIEKIDVINKFCGFYVKRMVPVSHRDSHERNESND